MHQLPRPAPRTASSANSPQTNPARTNNQREGARDRTPSTQSTSSGSERSGQRTASETGRTEENPGGQGADSARLNLIVQRFFCKAALIVISSRLTLPPAFTKDGDEKIDKWFNTYIEDTHLLTSDLQEWRALDLSHNRPPPLVIDMYLDLAQLTQNQTLVAVDDDLRRWDVSEALRNRSIPSQTPSPGATTKLIYERWTISLDDPSNVPTSELADPAPNVYKKGVVLLRSLFTYCKILPAWKFARRARSQIGHGNTPKLFYEIHNQESSDPATDTLDCPITSEPGPVTESFHFNPLPCTFGALKVSVTYRTSCNFEVETSERLLSEHFVGGQEELSAESGRGAGSTSDESSQQSSRQPWSRMHSGSYTRTDELPVRATPSHRTSSGSKTSLKSETVSASMPRRPSVSFQPFKAGSLSSSPANGMQMGSSPGRTVVSALPSHRSRSSLTTLPQQALRNPAMASENAIASSASSSPKPAPIQRYSSSFGNRRSRLPSGSGSKADEDGNSSRGSVSSTQRGSDTLVEGGEASSPNPGQDDSESIGDFLKMLDKSSKGLTSFSKTDEASVNANSQRATAQYSRFARMRDSTAQLSDSMSSSLMLQRSSTSSSRQLSNVPGLVGGQSVSTGSSPGKPVSPHTPHMPAVPSRLSNNSIIDYSHDPTRSRMRPESMRTASHRQSFASASSQGAGPSSVGDRDRGTIAIDIPTSPRTYPTSSSSRRSSSVHPQGRMHAPVDEDVMPFGLRSASLPVEERPSYAADDDEPLLFAMGT